MSEMKPKTPLAIVGGIAAAAIAAVIGMQAREHWMPPDQLATVGTEKTLNGQQQAQNGSTAAEQPGTATTTTAAATTDTAAPAKSETPAETKVAAVEQPAPAAKVEPATVEAKAPGTPTFDTVRVEKTGDALIAGRADPGAKVTVMLDGKAIGDAVANSDGAFVVTPDKALPPGSGSLTLEATDGDAGAAKKSDQSVAVIVPGEAKTDALVAVISPDAPTRILQKPAAETAVAEAPAATVTATDTSNKTAIVAKLPIGNKPVSLDAVDYDAKGNIVFSGSGTPGSTARLYVDNTRAGDAVTGDDGTWTFAGSAPIGPGKHTLRVDGLDAQGKVKSRIELPFFREEQTKVASAATSDAPGSGTAEPKDGRVVIQPGNNLWRISRVIYGEGTKFTVIFEANKDRIRNPDMIYPGQVFATPGVVAPEKIDPLRRDPLQPGETTATP
ncbi:LysM peptidoglycan-binding domain-containing protein [Aestuariivirga sp.]|uniref:LysM peptidoglycan-binding domain-containing protein n=1 Tax=Aestuariivirga sp. TaxID=2650926 RepID=UPI0039E64FFC